jgi:hypothetical protein
MKNHIHYEIKDPNGSIVDPQEFHTGEPEVEG